MEDKKMEFINSYLENDNEEEINKSNQKIISMSDGLIEETIDKKLILEDGRYLLRD